MHPVTLLLLAVQAVFAATVHLASGPNTIEPRSGIHLNGAYHEHKLALTPEKRQTAKPCASGAKDTWGKCLAKDRRALTIRASNNATDDVSAEFEQALRDANHGGLLRLEKGKTYVIGKVLNLGWVNDVHIQLEGTIKFTDNIEYWQKNNIYHPFQKSIAFWRWGGSHIRFFGGGTIDGSGQKWWDGFAANKKDILDKDNTFYRPILFYTENLTRIDISHIKLIDSPAWFTFFVNTNDIVVDNTTFAAKSSTIARPKNSDGFDTYNVDGMRITSCRLEVDDDCISPKPNTTNLFVENVYCKGSHGISMGSIGQYPGIKDYISNVLVRNVTMAHGTIGVRLKAWAGEGVGHGYMRNITYENIVMDNIDEPIVLDQCYFNIDKESCRKFPSKVDISGVRFVNITGTSSGKMKNVVGTLRCSPAAECTDIELDGINLRSLASVNATAANLTDKPIIKCEGITGITPGYCTEDSTLKSNGTKDTKKTEEEKDNKTKSGVQRNHVVDQILLALGPLAAFIALNW